MKHTLYNSIEEMIRPDTLSGLEQKTFTATHLAPFQRHGASGSRFLAVHTTNGSTGSSSRYVVKQISREWDWIMNSTGDRYGRTTSLWQHGILDRLSEEIEHTVVACAKDGTGRAILMRDVTDTLLPDGEPISEENNELILDAMAALHATFWEDPILQHPSLNLCAPERALSWTSPEMIRQMLKVYPHEFLEMVLEGWALLPTYVEADVAELLYSLAQNPTPLCNALARFPWTLVHNDIRAANLGVVHGEFPHIMLLDWMLATATVPASDLARYFLAPLREIPASKEAAISFYKQRLAQRLGDRFDESWWQPQLELSLLAGFVKFAGIKARFATSGKLQVDFPWWSEQVRAGTKWLA